MSVSALKGIKNSLLLVPNLKGKVKLPDKLKGTVVERWADYWKNLFKDYRQMVYDLRTDIQDKPRKALLWTAGISVLYGLYKNNPDELDFKDQFRRINNEVVLVSEDCRNPRATEHLRFLETCYNQGVIHYRNLGLLSLMYTSDMTASCDLYKAHCSYLKQSYFSFPSRIIDIGFMGRWWNVYRKTTNYDVNFVDDIQ